MTTKPGTIAFPSRIGVWWNSEPWPIPDAQNMVREIEALGYGSLFMPEGSGKDVMVQSAAFLGATESLVIGTGIANVHVRIPTAAESGARTLTALYPGRFVLGLGVSHAPFVERTLGGEYRKPLSMARTHLERMNSVPAKLEPGARPTRLLAALGAENN
ncbi:LLM class flavin-dependent oxidoreductase [Rhodococcoides fascians]|uniref:LLM class flavin-dependent oxidoreductase n=1 Tax=Rhodococcoides fascians TaxID=1828 RepID=UPI000A559A35|nr:LLM class flavin-dependent oxidoreductase [Rhodococcus fascians]